MRTLPQDLQTAIGSVAVKEELTTIGATLKLHVDDLGAISDLIDMTLAGFISSREFLSTLTEILPDKKREDVLAIAEAVNKQIFTRVHDSLHKIERGTPTGEQVEAVAVPENIGKLATNQGLPETKLTEPTTTPASVRDISYVNRDPKLKMIPADIKQRINSDPYKEPIE